jgi:hypothetical protein
MAAVGGILAVRILVHAHAAGGVCLVWDDDLFWFSGSWSWWWSSHQMVDSSLPQGVPCEGGHSASGALRLHEANKYDRTS